jgi:hypothetical protein
MLCVQKMNGLRRKNFDLRLNAGARKENVLICQCKPTLNFKLSTLN